MFPYDSEVLAAVSGMPQSVDDVIGVMQRIDNMCGDGDGLKWFNWLYLQVTVAVDARVKAGGFSDPTWMADLDVRFAALYFGALQMTLGGRSAAQCWQTLLDNRQQTRLTRIQFALAGMNAHIVHDLPQAVVTTGNMTAPHYADYTALNSTLDSLIEEAKQALLCRFLGEPVAMISQVEDLVAGFSIGAAREVAWRHAGILAHLEPEPKLAATFMHTLDALTSGGNRALLVVLD